MQEERIDKVEYYEQCPICKKNINIRITKRGRDYNAFILEGCSHVAEGQVDQAKYRILINMIKALYQDTDLIYSTRKKKEELENLKKLGIDITKYL